VETRGVAKAQYAPVTHIVIPARAQYAPVTHIVIPAKAQYAPVTQFVIPAKAGIHWGLKSTWIPSFAGMT